MKKFFKKHPDLKTPAIVSIIYVLIALFILSAIASESGVKVSEKEKRVPDDAAEIHPARTFLIVEYNGVSQEYYARLEDKDSISSMFDYHRENSGLTFSYIGYTYGEVFDELNGIVAPDGYEWKVYDNEEEITYQLEKLRLQNNHTYTVRLEIR